MKIPYIKKWYKTAQLVKFNLSPCEKYIVFGVDLHNNEEKQFMMISLQKKTIVGV